MIFASLVAQLLFISFVSSTASNAPPDGKVLLAAWLDTNDVNGPGSGDRPLTFSKRFGLNISAFQFAQDLPNNYNSDYMANQINALSTDAILFITVYPKPNPWDISDKDIAGLAIQCQQLNARGRRVLIRFAPEFNGEWMEFGISPSRFIPLWKRVYTAIKAVAHNTDMIWSPNAGNSYPWSLPSLNIPAADLALLDTNGNGHMDAGDDAYSPYYPGDDYVDWVGTSNYHFGSGWPYYDNSVPMPHYFESNINAGDLYNTYAVKKNKPFSISETGAAIHPEEPPGPGELAIKQAWWQQTITNIDLLTRYPQIKMFCMFEFQKIEGANNADLRDFRISSNATVLAAFKADFASVQDRYVMANYTAPPPGYIVTPDGLFDPSSISDSGSSTNTSANIINEPQASPISRSSSIALIPLAISLVLMLFAAYSQF